ncbi:MAG: DUF5666 domain-containing protein [Rhodoferax sp.]|nr:DUF5666 domain-containing protein [Rhodoferax sp.]
MRFRTLAALLLTLSVGVAIAQDASSAGRSGGGPRGGMWSEGRGTVGTVTAIAADHFTIKTELGETYTIHFSVNTRIVKQVPGRGRGPRQAEGGERTPPVAIKATDIQVGDAIAAGGEVDAAAKSVGAVMIMLIDPESARQMRAMEANYGKTWLMGRVTAVNELRVTLEGGPDKAAHTFVADENTTFRKRREPITLADIQVGDRLRVEGAVKDGTFVATTVSVMGLPPGGEHGPGNGPPPQ